MSPSHGPTHDPTRSGVGAARVDRRTVLRGAAAGAAALAATGGPPGQAVARAAEASPVATPPAERGYAPVNGLDLYYESHGTGQPLVLLHGGLGTIGTDFGGVLPALARGRRVIGVELQAHGHTADIDRPLRFESMADDVAALVAWLGLGPTDVWGFSLGGGVALQTAVRHPEVVRKLVIASAVFQRDGWHPEVLAGMAGMNAEAAQAMAGSPPHQAYVERAPNPDDWPTLVAKLGELLAQDYDWTDAVRTIAAPALLAFGDADNVRLEHAVALCRLLGGGVPGDVVGLPASQLAVLPNTTHFGMLTGANRLFDLVPPFLDAPVP